MLKTVVIDCRPKKLLHIREQQSIFVLATRRPSNKINDFV